MKMCICFFQKIFLLFLLGSFLSASESELQKVSLQLQWKHQFEFAGFYMAKEKGFYKDVGLDVDFLEFTKKTNIVDSVLSGKAHYALGYSSIIADYLNGKPIVFIANFFKQSPLVLVTQKNITSLSQLKGKRVEGIANNIDNITLYTMLNKFGISEKDIQTLEPTFGIDQFINKNIDAMSAFTTNELYLLNKAGVQYNLFDPVSYGAKYYDVNLFTSKEELLNNPKRVQNFKDASIKGWEYALAHKEEAADLILKKYNSQKKSKEALLFEAKQIEHIMLPKVHAIGSIDQERVAMIADRFIQSGFIPETTTKNLNKFIWDIDKKERYLSEHELKYLQEKEILTLCIDPDWMPIEGSSNAKHQGMSTDYWDIFQKELGLEVEIFKTANWKGSLEAIKQNKCDILSFSAPTKEREKYLSFTDTILEIPLVVITSLQEKNIIDFSLLDGKSIAVTKGYAVASILRTKYPKIHLVEVESLDEGFEKLEDGKVFGFADAAVVIDYAYKSSLHKDFKISAHFDEKLHLALAVSKDNIKLHSILQKVIKTISVDEKQNILKKWFFGEYKKPFDYLLFGQIGFVLLMLLGFIIYRQYVVQTRNKELKLRVAQELKNSQDKDKMMFHQRKLVAMGEMIENIAHQWRQPLSQVNSCVLVIDDVLDSKGIRDDLVEEKLSEIESLTKYMSRTVEDFRNFFDKNKEKSDFILEKVIDHSLDVVKSRIIEHKIQIIRGLATQHSCYGYPNELEQAILAILNNAIDIIVEKKIENGKISIDVDAIENQNIITIRDNAGGIEEEVLEKVFEPYYTTKHKTQGAGLGLYIAKIIVENSLHGELHVKSNFKGASFMIVLYNESNKDGKHT